jgi:Protein of unknown function (DUF3035)
MRKTILAGALAVTALTSLTACGAGRRFGGGSGPDEMAVARAAPLVVPPDFALSPPKPGTARPQDVDSSTQALQAMFGGPAARSAGEAGTLSQAGAARAATGIRSEAGDPGTTVVDKGAVTQAIVAAPAGDGEGAKATTPQ